MCEHCGCRQVEPIAELMDEHEALLLEGAGVRAALGAGDLDAALARLAVLAHHLDGHVRKEEGGIFAALRAQDEFVDEVEALEREHVSMDAAVATATAAGPADLPARVERLLGELEEHVERENLGVFPVSIVTLGARGWDLVERARDEHPTFLAPAPAGERP